jgi:CDP-2,3-bis-(O-geranylgeranyl)-sn-glycerol synthase
MNVWAILQSLLVLALANYAPVVGKKMFGTRFAWPLDGGKTFTDNRAIFGPSKTVRGIGISIAAASVGAAIIGVRPDVGALMAAAAMAGDLFSSFVKRRLNLPPSSQALGLDQVPESLLPLLVVRHALSLSIIDILLGVAIFFVGEILLARLFYKLGWRDQPY